MKLTTPVAPGQTTPASIFIKLQEHPLVAQFLEKENLSAIDIGCSMPMALWDLYHDVGMTKLQGIERLTQKEVIEYQFTREWRADQLALLNEKRPLLNNVFDLYRYFYAIICDSTTFDFRLPFENLEQYREVFHITYGCEWDERVTEGKKFDYVILSNVLHLQVDSNGDQRIGKRVNKFFNNVVSLINPGGMIYIRVPHEDALNTNRLKHIRFNEETFRKLIGSNFSEVHFEIEPSENSEIKNNSIVFLGLF